VSNTTTFNILATNTTTGCSAQLTDLSTITTNSFDASAWNVTGLSGTDTITQKPVSRPDICPQLTPPDFKPDNSIYDPGATYVLFRVDREKTSTTDWTFFFDLYGVDVTILDAIVTGNSSLPTVNGNQVDAGNNDHVFMRFKIKNVPGTQVTVNFTISTAEDGACGDENLDNDYAAEQIIDPMPAVGPFDH
jgi:hypothetical protein